MIYQTPAQFAARTDAATRDANQAAFGRFVGALQEAGVLVTTLGIDPPETAGTVLPARAPGSGQPEVRRGPYADTGEQLGGLCVIEAENLEEALAWAKRAPFDHCGPVEVRPTRVV